MWEVVMRPDPRGIVVLLHKGATYSLVGRVAYHRWVAVNKLMPFKMSLRRVIARAENEAIKLNRVERVPGPALKVLS